MSHPYDPAHSPPFPAFEVMLKLPEGGKTDPLLALIDTGADATIIPQPALDELGARPEGDGFLRDQWGGRHPIDVYTIDIEIAGFTLLGNIAAGDANSNELILGRNVLNKLVLLLDGPGKVTNIFETRPQRIPSNR
ncbi:MAG: hypothetical protein ACE5GO_00710 [Anaerolineales bacterium]